MNLDDIMTLLCTEDFEDDSKNEIKHTIEHLNILPKGSYERHIEREIKQELLYALEDPLHLTDYFQQIFSLLKDSKI